MEGLDAAGVELASVYLAVVAAVVQLRDAIHAERVDAYMSRLLEVVDANSSSVEYTGDRDCS